MDQNEELANSVSKRLSEVEKRRSHIVKAPTRNCSCCRNSMCVRDYVAIHLSWQQGR